MLARLLPNWITDMNLTFVRSTRKRAQVAEGANEIKDVLAAEYTYENATYTVTVIVTPKAGFP